MRCTAREAETLCSVLSPRNGEKGTGRNSSPRNSALLPLSIRSHPKVKGRAVVAAEESSPSQTKECSVWGTHAVISSAVRLTNPLQITQHLILWADQTQAIEMDSYAPLSGLLTFLNCSSVWHWANCPVKTLQSQVSTVFWDMGAATSILSLASTVEKDVKKRPLHTS